MFQANINVCKLIGWVTKHDHKLTQQSDYFRNKLIDDSSS